MRSTLLAMCGVFALASSTAFAADCVDKNGKDISHDPQVFQTEIESKATCYEAAELARACAWGSSIDVSTAGIAYEICEKELQFEKPEADDLALLRTLENRCTTKYENEQGTMYRSMHAYCQLSAIEWILSVSRK